MIDIAKKMNTHSMAGYIGPARVLETDQEKELVHILLGSSENIQKPLKVWAHSAIPYPHELKWGETVIVVGQESGDFYIIGLLNQKPPITDDNRSLHLKNGEKAEVDKDSEKLSVHSKDGELLFEYDSKTGKTRVHTNPGDLEIINQNGNIDFIASKDIRFFSRQSIEMKSLRGLRLTVLNVFKKTLSGFNINNGKIELKAPEIDLHAKKGHMDIANAQYMGENFSGTINNVQLFIKRLETSAETVIQKAVNIYHSVKELTQLTTGRMRTLVDKTYQFKSKKAFLKTEEDFKIKAEKIHLG